MFGTVDAVWLAVFACVVLFLLTRRTRFALPTLRDSDFAIPEKSTPASLLELQRAIAASEAAFEPLSCRKEVVYANEASPAKTEFAVVAIHGWSASPRELAPLDARIAKALGANLFRQRLSHHGYHPLERGGQALVDLPPRRLFVDAVTALAVGRALGERVVIVSSSTGSALAAWLCSHEYARAAVAGVVCVSPCFSPYPSGQYRVLKKCWRWLPRKLVLAVVAKMATKRRAGLPYGYMGCLPLSEEHKIYWTHRYPVAGLGNFLDVMWTVEHRNSAGRGLERCVACPMVVFGNPADRTVDFEFTLKVMRDMGWNGKDDNSCHVRLSPLRCRRGLLSFDPVACFAQLRVHAIHSKMLHTIACEAMAPHVPPEEVNDAVDVAVSFLKARVV